MSEELKKAWVFMPGVARGGIEGVLNSLAATGYHIYRMDRWTQPRASGLGPDEVFYDVVALNPTLVGELHGANLTKDLMQGLQSAMAAAGGAGFKMPGT